MSAATRTSRRRMGLTTLISSIFIVASLVWATYNFAIVQWGANRDYSPHFPYEYIPYWPYDNQFAGGRTNWFDNVNYTDVPLDQQLPDDILDQLDNIIFTVAPADPPQLWRVGAYDSYDGAHWGKTQIGTIPLDALTQLISTGEATNEIYTVVFNATAGANVGAIELPSLHPDLRVIEDSFVTWSIDGNGNPYPDPGRLLDYDLETDAYNTLLFTPFIQGTTGEEVIVTFQLSYDTQDLANVAANAQPGSSAPGWADVYLDLPDPLTQRVQDNISQFIGVGNNAYETAMAVNLYFQTTFNLTYTSLERPPAGQEVTDWFLERGGGLPMDFATAYCVFMRGLGIPARLTLGYAVGEADPTYSYRTLKVRHMAFWSEVFIPMSGATEGEWIQVVPLALPSDMGGDEVPTNAPIPNVQLNVWPSNRQPWEQIGTPFMLSANITVDGVPVTTPETITFYDETDTEFIGVQTIGQSPDKPIANVTYVFPSNATVDYHIIAATWTAANFSITNRTAIFAVGTPNPDSSPSPPSGVDGFVLSETRQLNVSQGVDTHFAFWEDTIHVYGTMKVGGVPVNSSKYDNRNIGIYWGNTFMGNASIDEYGYYELDIYVDPLALALMTVGDHEVWSWYLGDWDQYGIPRLNEARSGDNSTTEVWGRVGFNLTVLPTDVPAGSTIDYDGVVYFLNGTVLPMGQQVGVFFHSQANTTRGLNATGGFTWSYTIPVSQPDGTYFAYANWSSPWPLIAGNWSTYIPINVGSSGTQLSINQWLPDPYYVGYNITIFGYLTHVSNGTGIGGQWVDIWWNNGSLIHLGSVLTAPDGYYELNYTLLDSDDGLVEYWSNFTSLSPTLASCESIHRFLTVKKFDVSLDPIFVTPNPVFLLQPIDIQGNLSLSEFSLPLANQWVDFWLQNSTGVFYIGSVMTNSTGGYLHQYTIPIGQATETVTIWANYSSPYYNVYDGQSSLVPLDIVATGTLISIQEDFGTYYVNETVLLYGFLQFANGTPIASEIVYIHWVNATGTFVFQKKTDAFGYYQMLYNCTPTQDNPGSIDVLVNWTSWTPIYDNAFSSIAPQIQLQRYYLEIAITAPTQLYVDETLFDIQGVLTYLGGTPPLAGEEVLIQFWDGSGWYDIDNP
ncbi:MAG: transglutaminase family protein, partial [Candidatus Thorarchaeota archaeon]